LEEIILAVLPSAITAFCFWLIEHRIQKAAEKREKGEAERCKKQEEREKLREKNELLLVQSVGAAIALGEATARAVQRIPDAHCNGDMHAALEYAAQVKHEQKEFLTAQGIGSLYD
jgi:hypothetical protein